MLHTYWNRGNPAPAEWASLGSLSNDDGDGNENGKKQNNNFARASRFFVHFFAVI